MRPGRCPITPEVDPVPEPTPLASSAAGAAGELLDTSIARPRPGTAVLQVRGEVDSLTTPPFEAAIADLLAASEDALVVDLTGVTFLGSSGLALLIQGAERAAERGVRLRLVATSRVVRRPLDITGTERLFDVYADVSSATRDLD
jgi:anti-sigma B factor antagonist